MKTISYTFSNSVRLNNLRVDFRSKSNVYIRPLSTKWVRVNFAWTVQPFVTFGWTESWWKHVLLRFVDLF